MKTGPARTSPRDPARVGPALAAAVRSWRVRGWLVASLGSAVLLVRVPLLGELGLELAVLVAAFAALAGADLGGAMTRAAARAPAPPLARADGAGPTVARLVAAAVLVALVVALPPGLLALGHGLATRICDLEFGLRAYALLPLTSAALFAAGGVAVALVTGAPTADHTPAPRGGRPRRRLLVRALASAAPVGAVLVLAGAGLYRFYAAPPVFSYSPIVGFFPGNLYDEEVTLGAAVLWSRLEQVLTVLLLLALISAWLDVPRLRVVVRAARPSGLRRGPLVLALVAAIGVTGLRRASGQLGYRIDAADIAAFLGGRVETEHFVIHHATTPAVLAELPLLVADHELRLAQVAAVFGVWPSRKIHSYYFASAADKARWMGARDVEMAKPWRREIYLDHRAFPHGSLRHEIAHVVAAEFGDAIFGVSARRLLGLPVLVNPGLIEGLAVAADWPGSYDRSLTPHQSVRAMVELGLTPSVDDLLSLRFFSFASARGYATAGSFLRYLLDTYGAAPVRALYGNGGDFAAAFGVGQDRLVAGWRAMIATITLPPGASEGARERFRHGSVFERPCPHAIRDRRVRAGQHLAAGNRAAAVALLRQVCGVDPGEPRHRLELADVLGDGGDAGEGDEAASIWRELADGEDQTSTLRAEAANRLIERAGRAGDWAEVGRRLAGLAALPLDDTWRRQVEAKQLALAHPGPAGVALRAHFFLVSGAEDALRQANLAVTLEPTLGLAWYLRGLRRLDLGDPAGGAADLERGLDLGLPGPSFQRNAARRLAVAAYRAGDHARVEAAITALGADTMGEIEHALARDWQQRLGFARDGHL